MLIFSAKNFCRHRIELDVLRDRQRRELAAARMHVRMHSNLLPSGGNVSSGYLTRSVDNTSSDYMHRPPHLPYHHSMTVNIPSRMMLSSSVSLPGSPPHSSFLSQHATLPLRDTLVRFKMLCLPTRSLAS